MHIHYTLTYIQKTFSGFRLNKIIILLSILLVTLTSYSQEMINYNPASSNNTDNSVNLSSSKKIIKKSSDNSMYAKGAKDADRYYADYRPYAGGFVSGLVLPPAGLVTTIIISSKPPKEFNLGIPDDLKNLKSDPEYFKGYLDRATKRKKQRTWAGFATGTAFFVSGLLMFGYLDWK